MYRSRLFWCWIAIMAAFVIPVRITAPTDRPSPGPAAPTTIPEPVAGPGPEEDAAFVSRLPAEPPVPSNAAEALPAPSPGGSVALPEIRTEDDGRGADDTLKRTVMAPQLSLRAGPSVFHPEIDILHNGDRVAVLYAYDGRWLKVRNQKNGLEGYIERGTLSETVSP